jgi:endonuclease/exonuclease/phosphatase family metal-dependent hydrolase
MMSVRFQAKVGQHLTVVTAYAPIDMGEDATKDAFHLMLFACLKEAPTNDKVVVMGDFNAKLGNVWQKQGSFKRPLLATRWLSWGTSMRSWVVLSRNRAVSGGPY